MFHSKMYVVPSTKPAVDIANSNKSAALTSAKLCTRRVKNSVLRNDMYTMLLVVGNHLINGYGMGLPNMAEIAW